MVRGWVPILAFRPGTVAAMTFVEPHRSCSRPMCSRDAEAVLLFEYSDRHVVLGQLRSVANPNILELCSIHAERFSPPLGWSLDDQRANIDDRADATA